MYVLLTPQKQYGHQPLFTISFLAVFDDYEGDAAHNKMMVGSMNAASKVMERRNSLEELYLQRI